MALVLARNRFEPALNLSHEDNSRRERVALGGRVVCDSRRVIVDSFGNFNFGISSFGSFGSDNLGSANRDWSLELSTGTRVTGLPPLSPILALTAPDGGPESNGLTSGEASPC